jgi:spore maturation protein CgeB
LQEEITAELTRVVAAWRPDVLVYLFGWGEIATPEMLKAAGEHVVKIAWLVDDPFLHDGSLVKVLPSFDRIYVVDEAWADNIRLLSGRPTRMLTCGVDLETFKILPSADVSNDMRCDTLFVGASYHGQAAGMLRKNVLAPIADLDLRIYGDGGWTRHENAGLAKAYQGRELSSVQANRAYNAAKIVLNIHHPQFHMGTSLRTFSVAAAGAFQLADNRPGLRQFLTPGKEVETFATPEELRAKALYYLEHDAERQTIARAGYERTRTEHTWGHRFTEMLGEAGFFSRRRQLNRRA